MNKQQLTKEQKDKAREIAIKEKQEENIEKINILEDKKYEINRQLWAQKELVEAREKVAELEAKAEHKEKLEQIIRDRKNSIENWEEEFQRQTKMIEKEIKQLKTEAKIK